MPASHPTAQETPQGALAFIHHESIASLLLLAAGLLALALANSPLAVYYDALLGTPVTLRVGVLLLDKPLLLWINDGLMAIFFFHVGLEIKREILIGELSSPSTAALPFIAAIGGIAVPALIYFAINYDDPAALRGWAIPTATDIAFAVGVLAVLGRRIPAAIKVFLLALAIIDDLGAILIIAFFYTSQLSVLALTLAGSGVAALVILNLAKVMRLAPYILLGIFVWVCVLKSGVHATLAGVITAFAVPIAGRTHSDTTGALSPAATLQHNLHPWINFCVLPLFAFGNAGVALDGVTVDTVLESIPLGIALGLFLGKPLGIYAFAWAAIRSGIAQMPESANRRHLLGVAWLAGIGFTMSLFIGGLAFPSVEQAAPLRIGVLTGSVLSAIAGLIILATCSSVARGSSTQTQSSENAR